MLAVWYDFWNLTGTEEVVNEMLRVYLEGWRKRRTALIPQTHSSVRATTLLASPLGLSTIAFALPHRWIVDTLAKSVATWSTS